MSEIPFLMALACIVCVGQGSQKVPRFEEFPVEEVYRGPFAEPVLTTREQRAFRTRIRLGVRNSRDVWIGPADRATRRPGPNFAGHYFAIRWGCGSQCVMMAIVDAKTGAVYPPPLSKDGKDLNVPLNIQADMQIDLRPESSLMVLNEACEVAFSKCGTYYFNWTGARFELLRFVRSLTTK